MYNRLLPFAFPLAILDKAPSVALQCCCGVLSWLTLSQDTCAAASVVLLSQAPCRAELLAVQGGKVAGAAAEEMESGGSSGAAAGEPLIEEVIDKSFGKGASRFALPQNASKHKGPLLTPLSCVALPYSTVCTVANATSLLH